MITGIAIGDILILMGINEKNATLANLMEISYPLFTCLFALLFFKESQLSMSTSLGALFILLGTGILLIKG